MQFYLRLGFEPTGTIPSYAELGWSAAFEPNVTSAQRSCAP